MVSVSNPIGPLTVEPLAVKVKPVGSSDASLMGVRVMAVTVPRARSSAGKSCTIAPAHGPFKGIVQYNPRCTGVFRPLAGVNTLRPYTSTPSSRPTSFTLSVIVPRFVPLRPEKVAVSDMARVSSPACDTAVTSPVM